MCKVLGPSQNSQISDALNDDKPSVMCLSKNDSVNNKDGKSQIPQPVHSVKPVIYDVSPAKVAQVERHSSTEGEESSSYSSGEDQTPAERSRAMIRSASPRRSASPMRRIQIGRTGSRRATALTIKSLNYFPARERVLSHGDAAAANSSEDEGSGLPYKRHENNVGRMSVQDAINLFESKQKDQAADTQKRRSSLADISIGANKSVLRRWSAGTRESSTQCLPDAVSEDSVQLAPHNLVDREIPTNSVEMEQEPDFVSGIHNSVETPDEVDVRLETGDERASYEASVQADSLLSQREEEASEKLTASAEWSRKKEAELDQMLTKMSGCKPGRYRKPETGKNQNLPNEKRGGFYDHYKEKRDEKLRGENARKRAEKEAQFRAMQQILNERKAEMASTTVNEIGQKQKQKHPSHRPQKSSKSPSTSENLKKEAPKPSVPKQLSSKASTLPAVRKSWPSTPPARALAKTPTGISPSPRATGTSPVKTPTGISSSATTPTRRKASPTTAASLPRSNPKAEGSLQGQKNVKGTQTNNKRSLKKGNEKQQQTVTRSGKTKALTSSGDFSAAVPAKPTFYSKATKKSSVVPLESKPYLRKGSGIGPGVGSSINKTKVSSQSEESPRKSRNQIEAQENESLVNTSEMMVNQQQDDGGLVALESHDAELELETQVNSPQKCGDIENLDQVAAADGNDSFKKTVESSSLKIEGEEESAISPIAWVEIEEHQDSHIPLLCDDIRSQLTSPASIIAPVPSSSPRVRHSLSQMLQEENSEPDGIEWGNAENPPAVVYHKDAPKGFKRLLKFARKSRGDANTSGWSSPSAFSEGEDDAEEAKATNKRNADNLLKKATLHAKNHGQQKSSLSGGGYERNVAAWELLSGNFTSFICLSLCVLTSYRSKA